MDQAQAPSGREVPRASGSAPKPEPARKRAKRGKKKASPQVSVPGVCPLTGLLTGPAAREALQAAVERCLGRGEPFTVALLDIDEFARHVQVLGVKRSDRLLSAVVARLQDVLSDEALLVRLAGDQFALGLQGVEVELALGLVERARGTVGESPFALGRGAQRRVAEVRISAGLAGLRRDADDLDGLLEQARLALWRAKAQGGDRLGLPARERMVLKTSYYPSGQLDQLKRLAQREGVSEAVLLRAALDDLLLKFKDRKPQG